MYDGIPYQVKQRAGDQGITAENMEKSQHTDFNEDTTNESANVAWWWRGSVVERRSLAGELSLSCARPAADG